MAIEISCWEAEPAPLLIKKSEMHLWRFSLTSEPPSKTALRYLLSQEELDRADRLLDRQKADDFILARSYLRTILGKYLYLPPQELFFRYNQYGKPFIAAVHQSDIQFNLSHSHHQGVLAITYEDEIGIDVEWIDPDLNYQSLADQFFSLEEQSLLNTYPEHKKKRGFYRLWTRKEALLKCLGSGFQDFPENFSQFAEPFKTLRTFSLMGNSLCTCAVQNEVKRIVRINTPKLTQGLIT